MSGLLNIASRALTANQTILQTVGHNIANVNTAGYSRQNAVLQTNDGQYTGAGYIGKGVEITTIQRNYSTFLNTQATLASAVSAGDTARSDKLNQLQNLFPGGANALGAAVSDMLNAFSDVASAPTDLTARTVALTRVSETAARLSGTATKLDELQAGVDEELKQKITSINTIAGSIARVNEKIARAQGNGQPPNDLLDQRDQLIRDLNKLIQTSAIEADDGTIGLFVGGSRALVLGTSAATVAVDSDAFDDQHTSKLTVSSNGLTTVMDENLLGGGEIPGLLRFKNSDLVEARNLLGRYAMAVTTSVNQQHRLGLDLDGLAGGNLFTPVTFGSANVLKPSTQAVSATLSLGVNDLSQLAASDYEISFTGAAAGTITRRSDGQNITFTSIPISVDGLTISVAGVPNVGDQFLIKPYSQAANAIQAEFATPRSLAVASPVVGKMGVANTGSLQLTSLQARTNPPLVETAATPVVLTFTGPNSYTRSDTGATVHPYTSGQSIEGTVPATVPLSQWSLVLQGVPKAGDTIAIVGAKDSLNNNGVDYKLNAGNASAIMDLRDVALFDGSSLSDGYASIISQIGVRTQSASYTAEVSAGLAATLETDRAGVSGVNLDEEAAKLLQYQQAYQASAKVIQVAQGIFDTLMQAVAR
jgi:flagellar hook-associated protein 1 FlgK